MDVRGAETVHSRICLASRVTAPEPHSARAGTFPRRRVAWWVGVTIAAVAVIALIAVLGGFNDLPVQKLPVAALGSTHIGNEITATITGSELTTTAPGTGYALDDGTVDLIVEATLQNTTNQATLFGSDLVRVLLTGVIDPKRDHPYSVVELRSGHSLNFLQPGLPTRVAFVWQLKVSDVTRGDPLIIGVFQRHPIANNPLFADAQSAPVPVERILTTVGGQ